MTMQVHDEKHASMQSGAPTKESVDSDEEAQGDGCGGQCCFPETNPGIILVKIGAGIAAGILFGWSLDKSRVFEPASIRGQMVFERWIMLKVFLAAMGTGQLLIGMFIFVPWIKDKIKDAMDAFEQTMCDKGLMSSCLGAFILGMGMTVSGACPGMVLAQIGTWTKNAIFTLVGVLLGALIYGLLSPFLVKLAKPTIYKINHQTIYSKLKLHYSVLAIPTGVAIMLAVALMEYFLPWKNDLDSRVTQYDVICKGNMTTNIITRTAWPPSVAGVVMGMLQLVIILAFGDTLGGSSSYMTIVSQWVFTDKLKQTFPYMAKLRCGLGNWWQVVYVLSATVGGCLSALGSDTLTITKGVKIPEAVGGGVLLLFGARLASGCTSGHGLSGTALFLWWSWIAVPAMFAGGIASAFLMQYTGALDEYDEPPMDCMMLI